MIFVQSSLRMLKLITSSNRNIFLLDCIGAFVSGFLLFFVLRPFNLYFGISKDVLLIPTIFAFSLSIFSLICLNIKYPWRPLLRIIIIANLFYCSIITGIIITYYSSLTQMAVLFFLLEVLIIYLLIYIEFRLLNNRDGSIEK